MKNMMIGAAIGALAVATGAIAADLKTVPFPPVRPAELVYVEPKQFYVGSFGGGSWAASGPSNREFARAGVVAGWQPYDMTRIEATYEYAWADGKRHSNAVMVNGILQYPMGSFTPYALIGTGYRWTNKSGTIWNAGGGVRYRITDSVESDLRYRYVSDYDRRESDNAVTFGLNYRF